MQNTISARRLIPAGLAIVAVTYGLARYTYGLFVPEIQLAFNLSPVELGVIASGSYVGYLLATVFGSVISATMGPRVPIIIGGMAATLGMMIIAVSPNPIILMIGVIVAGASPGLAYPPLSDVVMQFVERRHQNRVYAVVNSGTSIGVIISAPIALYAGANWRMAWFLFALMALVAAVWNARLLKNHGNIAAASPPALSFSFFFRKEAMPLFAGALLFGTVTSVYWTFAVSLVVERGGLAANESRLFWILMGVAGLVGGIGGDLTKTFGLKTVLRGAIILLSAAIIALVVWSHIAVAVYASGLLFGACFILATGLYGIWSVNIFNNRPSAGFGATFFLISAGQLIGPTMAGIIAAADELSTAFWASAFLGIVAVALMPTHRVKTMARE